MSIGRPPLKNREDVIADIRGLKLSADEIADKHGISKRIVYVIAEENELNMAIRTKLMRLIKQRNRLEEEIEFQSSIFQRET